nr:MAG TPA: distal tail protein [Caudoviricetes sp.]
MYDFIDVNEYQSGSTLPSEALMINGEYIEDQIPGYRTLYVKGREMLNKAVTTQTVESRDGADFRYSRYPERTITVGYVLEAADNAAFRAAFNQLNTILSVDQSLLVFADESDKFFRGTLSGIEDVTPGRNTVRGEFSFICSDPFKYSLQEYEASPNEDDGTTFVIDYKGTYKSFPTLEATIDDGDCGYIAFLNDNAHIIQLGDPEETEGESFPASQTLFNQSFTSWNASAASGWGQNSGDVAGSSAWVQVGSVKTMAAGAINILTAGNYGSGSQWHGPTITRVLPADASGVVGSANFRMQWKQLMSIGTSKTAGNERGIFQMMLINTDSNPHKIVAGVSIMKSAGGTKATKRIYVGNSVYATNIDLSYHNGSFGWTIVNKNGQNFVPVRTCSIEKKGSTITFNIAGIKQSYTDPSWENLKVHQVTIAFGQYGSQPALFTNGLYYAKFIADNCTTWQDIPNKFSAGDTITANCSNADICLNGLPSPELGALGNEYEDFYLSPGPNQIHCVWSDWAKSKPTFKLRYREVYL